MTDRKKSAEYMVTATRPPHRSTVRPMGIWAKADAAVPKSIGKRNRRLSQTEVFSHVVDDECDARGGAEENCDLTKKQNRPDDPAIKDPSAHGKANANHVQGGAVSRRESTPRFAKLPNSMMN